MVAISKSTAESDLVRHYDDGAGWSNATREKERAFRRGFVEEARRFVAHWIDADDNFDPYGEVEAAHKLRRRIRERYSVYGPGHSGARKACHFGYRPGHEIPAARARGRHHALAYVTQAWDEMDDLDTFERLILPAWLTAVERWARESIRPSVITVPPRPLEIPGMADYLDDMRQRKAPSTEIMRNGSGRLVPRRLELVRADQIEMRPPDWLLRGMLERDTFALVFGDPGCGKSFLAIDWACRIATGTPWRGQAVKAGPVVYIAGEGQNGFGRRIRAWQLHNDVSLNEKPLYLSRAVAMPNPADLVALATAIDRGVAAVGGMPAMIVLDTLARNFGGGDESSTQDMTRFVASCDAIRKRYGCTVLVVHHTGHADKSRARGAMALKAALDVEYRLEQTAKHEALLTATKMKDAEEPEPMGLSLVTVELPDLLDDYGNPVTSAAIEVLGADTGAIVSKAKAIRPRGKWQDVGLAVARRLVATRDDGCVSIDAWRNECQAAGMVRQNQHRVLEGLVNRGDIDVTDGAMSIATP